MVNQELIKIEAGKGLLTWPELQERLSVLIPDASVNTDSEPVYEPIDDDRNLARLSTLFRAILQAECRTFSHFAIIIKRYIDLLPQLSFSSGPPTRKATFFWKNVHRRRLYGLDKLAQYSEIDLMSIL